MNGARRNFRIVGLAQSPEFLYATAPGELVPDDARFAVLWLPRRGLAAAHDLEGAFNEVLIKTNRNANEDAVIDAVDRVLAPYGGLGAYPLADQFSNRFVSEEIRGVTAASVGIPPFFLTVASFLLYIVISRIVASEREEIGLLKAFGYSDLEVGAHYFKMILVIATGGAALGCLAGIAAGRAMVGVYTQFYKFPFLVFQLDAAPFLWGTLTSILAASAGGLLVLRRVFLLAPAAAMRPPAPADYSRSGRIGRHLLRWLDQPTRMVLRRLTRYWGRMGGAVIGIACGMALSTAMMTINAGFSHTIDKTFSIIDRSDMTVTFTHPVAQRTLHELTQIDGVLRAEPVRHVPVVFGNGLYDHLGAITGLPPSPELSRALDSDGRPISMPENGIVLSEALAGVLRARVGTVLTIDLREGAQTRLTIPVTGIAESLLGSPAYMRLEALNRVLGEPGRISGAYLVLDDMLVDQISHTLRDLPGVAGIALKSQAQDRFQELMDQGAGSIRYVMGAIAFVISFGIVYNAARIAFAERIRDLASLRVMGFTTGETTYVLLGELIVVTLIALPLGSMLGHQMSFGLAAAFSTELYQIPALFSPASHGVAALVVITATAVSALLVRRELIRTDLILALKTRD